MEHLLKKLTKVSIEELESNDFRYPSSLAASTFNDDGNDDVHSDDSRLSMVNDPNISISKELPTRLNNQDDDTIVYTGRSASIDVVDPNVFRIRPCVPWPGYEHVSLRLTSENELIVERGSRVNIGVSMRIDLDPSTSSRMQSLQCDTTDIPPLTREQMDAMIALYFSHLHTSFPIINKSCFQNAKNQPSILVHAILALTFRFVSQHFPQNRQREAQYAAFYFAKVMRRLRDSTHSRISHVQAAILMTLYLDDDDCDDTVQWYTLGTAIRMAQDLGLHRSCSHWKMLPQSEIQTRHRIFYACYILDRWLSARGGKPLTILDREFDIPLLLPRDDDVNRSDADKDEDDCDYPGFLIMGKLAEILGRVLKALYAPKAKYLNSTACLDDTTLLESFDRRLKACKSAIDNTLPLRSSLLFLCAAYLELYYNLVVLLLHRPFLSCNALSHNACTAAASNIGHIARQNLPAVSRRDPDSCFSLTLPTCLVYSLFQSSLIHLTNAVRDPTMTQALDRTMVLLDQFQHMVTARRARQVFIMFRALHFAWLLDDPVSNNRQDPVYSFTSQPHIATQLYNSSPSFLPPPLPPQPAFLSPHPTQDYFSMAVSAPALARNVLPNTTTITKGTPQTIHHQHSNSMSSASSSSSFASTPHLALWSSRDVCEPYRTVAAVDSTTTSTVATACPFDPSSSFDFSQLPLP
ncbi:fungal-specific transcription factor domain-containing protein [Dichotomocladium elegans]|nr:fungal-specific transcription factor domain-containing protein [Dichotomocladium elegans]